MEEHSESIELPRSMCVMLVREVLCSSEDLLLGLSEWGRGSKLELAVLLYLPRPLRAASCAMRCESVG